MEVGNLFGATANFAKFSELTDESQGLNPKTALKEEEEGSPINKGFLTAPPIKQRYLLPSFVFFFSS